MLSIWLVQELHGVCVTGDLINSRALCFSDSCFELDYILIDSCTGNPCQIPIGREVRITGSFSYSGKDMEKDIKLKHRPNWLLNYVYTAAIVVQNGNRFPSSSRFDFEALVYVDESLAPLKGTLNWRLYNEDDERIACYNIPIQLTLSSYG